MNQEKNHLQKALLNNNYPQQFVKKFKRPKRKREDQEEEVKGYATLPYVKDVTERIQRVLKSHNIKTSTKPVNTLSQLLCLGRKDQLTKEKKTGVIYSIPCGECDTVYI